VAESLPRLALIGGLFAHRVPERQPTNPRYKAVTLRGTWEPPAKP